MNKNVVICPGRSLIVKKQKTRKLRPSRGQTVKISRFPAIKAAGA